MIRKSAAAALLSVVVLTVALVSPASAAWTNGCISGVACFRKASVPATQVYTSSSDSNWAGDYVGNAPADQYRQRMSTYELYTYRYANYSELDMCAPPEGSSAVWRWLNYPTGSNKVLNIDAC
jgi:hypothetical protein